MNHWNYRIIEFVEDDGNIWRAIHEVHYDDEGNPVTYTEEAASIGWNVSEGDSTPTEILNMMSACLDKPVLVEKDFSFDDSE